jgi:RimJ/RimL family protein N-acetyltransferase
MIGLGSMIGYSQSQYSSARKEYIGRIERGVDDYINEDYKRHSLSDLVYTQDSNRKLRDIFIIGTAGFKGPPDLAGVVEIAYGIVPDYEGRGYATEAAEKLLEFGFDWLGLDEIVSFAVWNNHASTAIMRRIGMRRDPGGDFDHPNVPETHPQLKRHVLYRLAASDWRQTKKAG